MSISELLQLAQKIFFSHDNCSKSDIAIFVREVFKNFFFPALPEGSDFLLSHCPTFFDQYSLRIFKLSQVFLLRYAHHCLLLLRNKKSNFALVLQFLPVAAPSIRVAPSLLRGAFHALSGALPRALLVAGFAWAFPRSILIFFYHALYRICSFTTTSIYIFLIKKITLKRAD